MSDEKLSPIPLWEPPKKMPKCGKPGNMYILSDLVYMMKYHLYNYNCLETLFYYLFGDGYNCL